MIIILKNWFNWYNLINPFIIAYIFKIPRTTIIKFGEDKIIKYPKYEFYTSK